MPCVALAFAFALPPFIFLVYFEPVYSSGATKFLSLHRYLPPLFLAVFLLFSPGSFHSERFQLFRKLCFLCKRFCNLRFCGFKLALHRFKLRHFYNNRYIEAFITNISIYLSIHKPYQPAANEKPKPVALHLVRIISTMKVLEYLRQFFRFKSTACI